MSRADELTDMIAPLIESFEYRLWNLTITKAQKRSIVTVTLDKDGGANLDEMAGISKEIASLIDEHPSFENEYHLEVESPGLERSLTNIEHFKWSINMEVSVSFRDGETLSRSRGILLDVNDENISIEEIHTPSKKVSKKSDSDSGDTIQAEKKITAIEMSTITKAHTVFDFEKAMKNNANTKQTSSDSKEESENI